MRNILLFSILIAGLFSCKKDEVPSIVLPDIEPVIEPILETTKPNILLIIADDLGKDAIKGFSEGSVKPTTPIIDEIRTQGLSFTNFWTYPTCTPTRSSIITGKYGYHTNVKGAGDVMSSSEVVLQKYINDNTSNSYATAIVGKWHLSGNSAGVNPESFGIDYYAGLIRGTVDDYFQWQLTEDGATSMQTDYTSTYFTDLAIDWVNTQTKPWFLWLAYNAPHTPFHAPPSNMHTQGNLPTYVAGMDATPHYMAAIEAMDYNIGRLLDSMSTVEKENTIIIFIGDNGTPTQVAQSPYSSTKVKNTLYQGGINAPLFVSGKGVSRTGTDKNLLCSTDLFSTIAQLSGTGTSNIHDSKSFASLLSDNSETATRNFQYSEMDNGRTDKWTIKNETYKIIADAGGTIEMYNISTDPYENSNLLSRTLSADETSAKSSLEAELSVIRK